MSEGNGPLVSRDPVEGLITPAVSFDTIHRHFWLEQCEKWWANIYLCM